MSRNTTRIQNFTQVTELADNDVLIFGPASGDRAKGITKANLEKQFDADGIASMKIVEVSETYTVLTSDDVVLGSGVSPITFNLPTVSSAVKLVTLKNMPLSADITIDPFGSELIEGSATLTLANDESVTLVPSSTNDWVIV